MTAHELARKLLALPDVPVTVRGYEGGVNIVGEVCAPRRYRAYPEEAWYYGKYDYIEDYDGMVEGLGLAIHLDVGRQEG